MVSEFGEGAMSDICGSVAWYVSCALRYLWKSGYIVSQNGTFVLFVVFQCRCRVTVWL